MTDYHQPPREGEYDPYYGRYIRRVPGGGIVATLSGQIEETARLLAGVSEERSAYRYAPGKWSVKEVVGHLADVERVLSIRALRFARGDATPLPGFDENRYVPAAELDAVPLPAVLEELRAVRNATVALLRNLPAAAWTRTGKANDKEVSVRALAWIVAGHELHHRELLVERYLGK